MSGGRSFNIIRASIARFLRAEDGVLPALALVFFVMILAVGGLSIDLGRLYGTRGQMQTYVDHAALAAATQLDRSSTAINRALCAATASTTNGATGGTACGPLITGDNTQKIATVSGLTVDRVVFMSKLSGKWAPGVTTPVTDSSDPDVVVCTWTKGSGWSGACDSAANNEAQYVEVRAETRTVNYMLLPLFDIIGKIFGAAPAVSSHDIQLSATAGYKQYLCNNVPLMVCNPDEATFGTGADFDVGGRDDGKMLHAKLGGPGASFGPGVFGLLSTAGNSASVIESQFASSDPNTLCTSNQVTYSNGQDTGPVRAGADVRFDMYVGNEKPKDAGVQPAPNVTKGIIAKNSKNCNSYNPSAQSMPFPRDNCFMSAGTPCTNLSGTARMGANDWNRNAYWTTNHPGVPQPPGYSTMKRYDVYRYEIEHPQAVNLDEKSGPTCYTGSTPISTSRSDDRRVFVIAVVDCNQTAVSGGTAIVKAYANVFLTEPVGNSDWPAGTRGGLTWIATDNKDIYAEIVGVASPGNDTGRLHQFPVLYR